MFSRLRQSQRRLTQDNSRADESILENEESIEEIIENLSEGEKRIILARALQISSRWKAAPPQRLLFKIKKDLE